MGNVSDDADVVNPAGRWGRHFRWMLKLEAAMSSRQLRVWNALVVFSNDGGECWPSIAALVDATGMDDRNVRRSLAGLEDLGVVARGLRTGRVTTYRIVRPDVGGGPDWPGVTLSQGGANLARGQVGGGGQIGPGWGGQIGPPEQTKEQTKGVSSASPVHASILIIDPELHDDAREDEPPDHGDPGPCVAGVAPQSAVVAPERVLAAPATPTHAPDMETQPGAAQAVLAVVPEVPDGVTHLHGVWQRVVGKPGWGLTAKRQRAFAALIRAAGSMTRAEDAVHGLGLSDWHMGRDPKTNGAQFVEPDLITRNLDRFCELATAARAERPDAGLTWDQMNADCLRAYVVAVRGITDHVDPCIASGTLDPLTDKQRAAFDSLLQPIGMTTWGGERVHVFQWRHEDGAPDNPRTMLFIKSINRAAALVARKRMLEKWPGSKVVAHIMDAMVAGTKKEALEEYAKALAVMRERAVDDQRCIVGEIVFEDGPLPGAASPTGETHAPSC